ncbi:hypothetical protein [Streptomyces sp. NPDC093544]|uniref:hypothetical protein n=1 Tax=Streptomyces sp. NPDC093544 TaxID=3155200 RepID=UPI00342D3195
MSSDTLTKAAAPEGAAPFRIVRQRRLGQRTAIAGLPLHEAACIGVVDSDRTRGVAMSPPSARMRGAGR